MNAKHVRNLAVRGSTVMVTAAAVTIAGGTAFAYWSTAPGSGSGAAKAGEAQALTTTAIAASITSLLYPNGPNADVKITVVNPNPFNVTVTGVTSRITVGTPVTASGGTGVCTTTGVTFVAPAAGVIPFTVPKNDSVTVTLIAAAKMDDASQTGCQKATFTIPVTLTGESVA
ncbi:MAG: hypothetical protein JWQ59_1439 [Cryobacterium sp.]|nr:hypothetical protein [Cryobacterium sp.]